jgi:RNA polymerase sigma-70 factor (ECF subfamily)
MNTTPLSLLEQLRRPAPSEAWKRFVRLYTPLLYYWVRRLGLPAQDTADVVQEVFAAVVPRLPEFRYDPRKSFRGWLWTVTLNKCRDLRRQARAQPAAGPTGLSDLDSPDSAREVDEAEYRHYLVKRAVELMQREFQPATWRAFWECQVNERPAAEVAAELGMSVAAAYAAKSRVLRRLRQELAGLLD